MKGDYYKSPSIIDFLVYCSSKQPFINMKFSKNQNILFPKFFTNDAGQELFKKFA